MAVIRETVDAGMGQTRRRIQVLQLQRDAQQKEHEIAMLVTRLGHQAWEHRVEAPALLESEVWDQLLARAAQIETLRQRKADLEQQIDAETEARQATEAEWQGRLNEIVAAWEPLSSQLEALEKDSRVANERLHAAEHELERTQKDLAATQARLGELDRLTVVDVDQRRTRFRSRIAGLEQAQASLEAQLPDLHRAVADNEATRPPLQEQLADLEQQAAQSRAQKGAVLGEHEAHLADLRAAVRERTAEIAALANENIKLSAELGPIMDQARPDAPALQDTYAAIDKLESVRINLLAQLADLKTESEAADITAVRRFYVLVGAVALVGALIVGCLLTMCLTGWAIVQAVV
ncbi:MAG: hypothetical protein KKA73_17055 [Chloroflexi bacterium]|nr:hypothetical protein [Chloroflexota bacterium]MBU1749397.1 hypothetical protein [Chloroflexota bacterium]